MQLTIHKHISRLLRTTLSKYTIWVILLMPLINLLDHLDDHVTMLKLCFLIVLYDFRGNIMLIMFIYSPGMRTIRPSEISRVQSEGWIE